MKIGPICYHVGKVLLCFGIICFAFLYIVLALTASVNYMKPAAWQHLAGRAQSFYPAAKVKPLQENHGQFLNISIKKTTNNVLKVLNKTSPVEEYTNEVKMKVQTATQNTSELFKSAFKQLLLNAVQEINLEMQEDKMVPDHENSESDWHSDTNKMKNYRSKEKNKQPKPSELHDAKEDDNKDNVQDDDDDDEEEEEEEEKEKEEKDD